MFLIYVKHRRVILCHNLFLILMTYSKIGKNNKLNFSKAFFLIAGNQKQKQKVFHIRKNPTIENYTRFSMQLKL